MRRRTVSLVAVLALVAAGVLVASAAALTPPPGTPDLSRMAIQPSDLAPGTRATTGAYVSAPRNFAAVYQRTFATAKTTSGVALLGLDSEVLLGDNKRAATGLFSLERAVYRTKLGRRELAQQVAKQSAKGGITFKISHFGKFRVLGIGAQSFLQPITLKANGVSAAADYVVVRIGAVVTNLTVGLLDPTRTLAIARELGGDAASHITAVLGASGPTGATGPSGASGPSGATGATGATG